MSLTRKAKAPPVGVEYHVKAEHVEPLDAAQAFEAEYQRRERAIKAALEAVVELQREAMSAKRYLFSSDMMMLARGLSRLVESRLGRDSLASLDF